VSKISNNKSLFPFLTIAVSPDSDVCIAMTFMDLTLSIYSTLSLTFRVFEDCAKAT